MRIRFRGTRGSLPAPGPDTVLFGGNTTCIEIRSSSGELLIFDAGTGIRELGNELVRSGRVDCHLFISHTHWDHIHGLPFFAPLFIPGNSVSIYGPPDPVAMTGIEGVLSMQMRYPHFPVRVAELAADIRYDTLSEGRLVDVGFASVQTMLLNHPAMNFGFKIKCDGKTLFFTGDHEMYNNIYSPGEPDYVEYETMVEERTRQLEEFLDGVDVLIADAQYTREEYASRHGWGHSCHEDVCELARRVGVGRVFLTHHETARPDDELEAIEARLRDGWPEGESLFLAREGEEVEL